MNDVEIVVVEDSENDIELLNIIFKYHRLSNKVVRLKDGAEALEFIFCKGRFSNRSIGDTPKIILLDLRIPLLSGLEVLKSIKEDPRTKNIPVIVMTSSSYEKDASDSYNLGVDWYIVKPITFDTFTKAVAAVGYDWSITTKLTK